MGDVMYFPLFISPICPITGDAKFDCMDSTRSYTTSWEIDGETVSDNENKLLEKINKNR